MQNPPNDAHLVPWLKARFGLTVENDLSGYGYYVYAGDYCSPDDNYGHDATVFSAAQDFACYGGELSDTLDAIETGAA